MELTEQMQKRTKHVQASFCHSLLHSCLVKKKKRVRYSHYFQVLLRNEADAREEEEEEEESSGANTFLEDFSFVLFFCC